MEFSNNADVSSRLEQVLFSQGFRDVRVTMSGSQSIAIELAGGQYRPISRAMARAARAAYALAPIGTRELIIGFSIDGHISATYEFIDFEGLKQFFTGQLSKGALAKLVKVRYLNPSVSQTDPLEFFDETSTVGTESMPVLLSDPLDRVWRDMKGAAKVSGQIDWLTSGTVGIGVVAAASFLDKRAFNFAKQHQQNRMVKGGTKIGDAIPFVALAGAGAGALLTTEPTLSRSSYASLEAGGTAVLASTALKYLVGRQRPTSADSPRDVKPLSFTSSRDSFPSRHTTVAWAAITPFAVQYDAPWLYGLAGVTQLGRIASRQHWFSDTVAGSLLGTAIGQVFQRVGNDNSLRTSPQVSLNPEGVTFAWTFN
jgi:hypothetical protein